MTKWGWRLSRIFVPWVYWRERFKDKWVMEFHPEIGSYWGQDGEGYEKIKDAQTEGRREALQILSTAGHDVRAFEALERIHNAVKPFSPVWDICEDVLFPKKHSVGSCAQCAVEFSEDQSSPTLPLPQAPEGKPGWTGKGHVQACELCPKGYPLYNVNCNLWEHWHGGIKLNLKVSGAYDRDRSQLCGCMMRHQAGVVHLCQLTTGHKGQHDSGTYIWPA